MDHSKAWERKFGLITELVLGRLRNQDHPHQIGSFEAHIIKAWFKADASDRRLLFPIMRELAKKYQW